MARINGDLKERTFEFAAQILSLIDGLPKGPKGWELSRQLIRSGTSVGANIREADQAHTDREFANKCSIARKEASETHYWLELCERARLLQGDRLRESIQEANELMRILGAIVKKTQDRMTDTGTKE